MVIQIILKDIPEQSKAYMLNVAENKKTTKTNATEKPFFCF